MIDERAEDILVFWFGERRDSEEFPLEQANLWFKKSDVFDRLIKEKFAYDFEQAMQGHLDYWKNKAPSCLTLIILLDQFSRNLFRNSSDAFNQDSYALQIALGGLENDLDKKLRLIERVFFYFPFEHSEDIQMQSKSIELFTGLVKESPVSLEILFRNYLDYAVKHFRVIEEFGRFPHRNKILNRRSTPEEIVFLNTPGASF